MVCGVASPVCVLLHSHDVLLLFCRTLLLLKLTLFFFLSLFLPTLHSCTVSLPLLLLAPVLVWVVCCFCFWFKESECDMHRLSLCMEDGLAIVFFFLFTRVLLCTTNQLRMWMVFNLFFFAPVVFIVLMDVSNYVRVVSRWWTVNLQTANPLIHILGHSLV